MTKDGYAELHPVGIEVRADFLEITAGWPDEKRVDMELQHALNVDPSIPNDLRWLATVIAAKLAYITGDE